MRFQVAKTMDLNAFIFPPEIFKNWYVGNLNIVYFQETYYGWMNMCEHFFDSENSNDSVYKF